MNESQKYALQWENSSQYFYQMKYYDWMLNIIPEHKTVLEVGCGTGYSTLALANAGFRVIAIEKNPDCLIKAKEGKVRNFFGYVISYILTDLHL